MWALSEAHVDAARVLIDGGADIHARSDSGFTPFMFAVRTGNMDAVNLLIDKGADIRAADNEGTTALHIATVRGHIDLAKFLLAKGVDPNASAAGYTALHYVSGKWDGVDAHDFVEAPGEWTYLKGLRAHQKAEMIKALFAHGADPNIRLTKEPPRYGFSLIAGSAKPVTAGATAFFLAAMAADVDVMRLLVAGGADPHIASRNGTTSLMVAAGMAWMENEVPLGSKDYLPATDLCVTLGVDVNAVNSMGNSAIHGTISGGFNPVIERLAAAGANVNLKNKRGDTPLKMSLGYGAAGGNHVRHDTAEVLRKLGGVE
jgi:ankyrin repeat protein